MVKTPVACARYYLAIPKSIWQLLCLANFRLNRAAALAEWRQLLSA